MAFEANVSIIKRLRKNYYVYYIAMFNNGKCSLGMLSLENDITPVGQLEQFAPFAGYLDFDRTYIVKHPEGLTLKKFVVDIKILKLVKKINPDVILTDAANVCMVLPRVLYKRKVISLIHDPFPHSGEDTFGRVMANHSLVKFAKRYVLFNQAQFQKFVDAYSLDSHHVFGSFLSSYEYLTVYDRLPVQNDNTNINILFYGRISPYKGIEYLLKAIKAYYQDGFDGITVTVAGRGDFGFNIEEYKDLPYVKIINTFIDTPDLVKMIHESSAIICPYTDATQSGVVMTAFAFGKPVIATRVGGLPEMLDNGKLGILIEPKNVDSIKKTFMEIRKAPSLLSGYSDKIKQLYIHGDKSWSKAVSIIEDAIKSL